MKPVVPSRAQPPMPVRAARMIIRRLPMGRSGAAALMRRWPGEPFWTALGADLGGLRYRCDLRDGLMREVFLTGRYEPQETLVLRHLLKPGATFVDVGANWGYFTLIGAHLVGARGRVIAIEADPRACACLRANVDANGLRTVEIHEMAASDETGRLSFQQYEPQASDTGNYGVAQTTTVVGNARRIDVESRALDDVLDRAHVDRVHVLKMDIEGGEARAIPGLRRRLADRAIDAIVTELHPFHLRDLDTSAADVIAGLRRFGYHPWRIEHSRRTHRTTATGSASVHDILVPFGDEELGDWPHLLWTIDPNGV
jgi:FkbM family methyltransferase